MCFYIYVMNNIDTHYIYTWICVHIYIYRWDVVHILQDISVSCYPWRHQGHQSQTLPHFQRRCFAFSPKSGTLLRLWMGSSFRHLPRTVWRPYRWPFGGSGGCSTFCHWLSFRPVQGMRRRQLMKNCVRSWRAIPDMLAVSHCRVRSDGWDQAGKHLLSNMSKSISIVNVTSILYIDSYYNIT